MAEDQYALSSSYSPSPSRLVSLRYYGRHEIVPFNDKSVTPIIEKIVSLSEDVVSISKRNPEWLSVKEDLELLAHKLMDEKVPMEKYRLEVISEAIIPYIEEMKARIHVDKSRFMQVKVIIYITFSITTHS